MRTIAQSVTRRKKKLPIPDAIATLRGLVHQLEHARVHERAPRRIAGHKEPTPDRRTTIVLKAFERDRYLVALKRILSHARATLPKPKTPRSPKWNQQAP